MLIPRDQGFYSNNIYSCRASLKFYFGLQTKYPTEVSMLDTIIKTAVVVFTPVK